MGFSAGSFAKVKEIKEDKGNYAVVTISITRKNRGNHEPCFASNVRFVGNAYKKNPMSLIGKYIKLTNCDTTNCFLNSKGDIQFNPYPVYTVFDFELVDFDKLKNGEINTNRPKQTDYSPPRADMLPDEILPF